MEVGFDTSVADYLCKKIENGICAHYKIHVYKKGPFSIMDFETVFAFT